jgi:queuine tRNA-ribosyltransferase
MIDPAGGSSGSRTPHTLVIQARDGAARAGVLHLAHGPVHTPALMPVGSQGTVKGILPAQLEELGVEMLLANSYHLRLRPGLDLIDGAGGLHRFMGWHRPILTDSGGFQVFSLASLCEVSDRGVRFRSHIDGSLHELTPEDTVEGQERLGSDIAMVLDEVPGFPCERARAERAVERTLCWAERSLAARRRGDRALYAIVQGGVWPELRRRCAETLCAMPFPGYAIGGISVGESREEKRAAVEVCASLLPDSKPRYLMGIGEPEDLLPAIAAGVDLFDCVIPTRCGRNKRIYTARGPVNLANARFRADFGPIEEGCLCPACSRFSAAYLHHLYGRDEMLGPILGTLHNLAFFQRLCAAARRAITEGRFGSFQEEFLAKFAGR